MAKNLDVSQPELFSQVFKYSPIGIALLSMQGKWLKVNASLCRITGYTESDFLDMTIQDILQMDDIDKTWDIRDQILDGKMDNFQMEKRFIHKNGYTVWVLLAINCMKDESGQPLYFITQIKDITERKLAEEDLKAKTEQLESFIENNADAILIFNNEGFVQRVNEAFVHIFGWSKEEVIGVELHLLPFIPPECSEEFKHSREQVQTGRSVNGVETKRLHKNGNLVNVLLTASPILDGKGKQIGWSVIFRDITEWKIAQEHLQNSEKLSVAGQLAAGIAHEIRNPITSIKGFIQLMKSGFGEKPIYFDIMTSEIERIELILSELLILAKPQSIKFERKDIRVLLSQVMTLLDSQAILNNVEFLAEFKPGATHLYCDENQLKQVFINFIKNSIESMRDGGKITLEVSSENDQEMMIRLADQGCGIPKETLSKLGQPFYTTKENGTGLGFMVSKKIIENHAGKIKVESEVNKGTLIEITLPFSN
ncbi:PAS domain S-box protein [Paenibacillus sp. P36]|uniref:PAS domain-containing sensor histidine kinase n=1 Tax=Paenibacillus sp. P36 TaxID=3342538 RepID=UPI0038B2914F